MKYFFLSIFMASFSVSAQIPKDCSTCSSEIIDENNLQSIDAYGLKLLKNEIYARKGYTFSSAEYTNYFKKFSWYKPLDNNESIKFSDIEIKNIGTIDHAINEISAFISTEQNSKYKTLSESEIKKIFTEKRKKELGITFNIWKVYDYQDKSGKFYLVLTEDNFEKSTTDIPVNKAIKAFNFKREKDSFTKNFEINDTKIAEESSIWFWSRYIYVEDFDNDGIIEPIIFYGTHGSNGYDDGRAKILIYYKEKKIGIRIQNGTLDDERNFSVDSEFYSLPKSIQDKVVEQMELMVEKQHSLLPYGWQKNMEKKRTLIKE